MKRRILIFVLLACMVLGGCSAGSSADQAMLDSGGTGQLKEQMGLNKTGWDSFWDGVAGSDYDGAAMTTAAATMAAAPDSLTANESYNDAVGAVTPPGDITMSGELAVDTGRKLIRTGWYSLETMDYPKTIQEIEALVNSVGGYIEGSSATGESAVSQGYSTARRASYTLRVPVEQFFEVGRALSGIAAVVHSEQSAQEVTDYYYDTEARLKTLRIQEERLLALMSQATELEAIIQLEQTLGETRYQIESNEGTLRRLDSQISFSTLHVEVQEVFEPTKFEPVPVTLGQRITTRFKSTLTSIKRGFENFLVVVLGDGLQWLITLAILAVIALAIWQIWKRIKARRGKPIKQSKRPKGPSAAAPPEAEATPSAPKEPARTETPESDEKEDK